MPITITKRSIDEEIRRKVMDISGQNPHKCFQCGTCAGSCPMHEHLSRTPREIMALLQIGQAKELEKANTQWVCASCHTCMVRCPRDIDIARLMEALRQVTLRQNINYLEPTKIDKEKLKNLPQIAMVSAFRKMTS